MVTEEDKIFAKNFRIDDLSGRSRGPGLDGDPAVTKLGLSVNPRHPVTKNLAQTRRLELDAAREIRERAGAPPGVVREPHLQHLQRLAQQAPAAVLLGQLEEDARAAVALPTLSQVGEVIVGWRRIGHVCPRASASDYNSRRQRGLPRSGRLAEGAGAGCGQAQFWLTVTAADALSSPWSLRAVRVTT